MTRGEESVAPRVELDARHEDAIARVEKEMASFAHGIQATLRENAAAIDSSLPPFGYKLLRLVQREEKIQASLAAEALFVDPSVVSRHVGLLKELGLITLRCGPSDGRTRLLELTPAGEDRMKSMKAAGQNLLRDILDSWDDEDLNIFADYMGRLNVGPTTSVSSPPESSATEHRS